MVQSQVYQLQQVNMARRLQKQQQQHQQQPQQRDQRHAHLPGYRWRDEEDPNLFVDVDCNIGSTHFRIALPQSGTTVPETLLLWLIWPNNVTLIPVLLSW